MPFKNVNELPSYTKKYSMKVRRQAMHVFNSTFKKILKETGSKTQADKRAFMGMHSVLKKRFKGPKSMEKNSRDDYFKHLVDRWLLNLEG